MEKLSEGVKQIKRKGLKKEWKRRK